MTETLAPAFTIDSHIQLRPLSKQQENDVVVIGYGDQFLELPVEGLDFLGWLEAGLTLRQARDRFEALHSPFPDEELIDVIQAFIDCDFVAAIDDQPIALRHAPLETSATWISQRRAQALFSAPVLIGWMIFVIPAVLFWLFSPDLWPTRANYFWSEFNFIIVFVAILVWLFNMSIHEAAHWLACRAKGINATITWTQRMGFMPMSQTIMHDIWAVPRSRRLLPISAGMIWDIFALSLVLYLLVFHTMGLLALPGLAIGFLKFLFSSQPWR